MSTFRIALIVCAAIWSSPAIAAGVAGMPSDAAEALAHPGALTLYSLEPTVQPVAGRALDHYAVLGKKTVTPNVARQAINEFKAATTFARGQPVMVALCFEPRHAISILSNGHTYDYLLCYSCGHLEVFRDGRLISDLPAHGSPSTLNNLLKAVGMPVSTSDQVERRQSEARAAQDKADWRRWVAATPSSIRGFDRRDAIIFSNSSVPDGARAALARQIPNRRVRIAALLEWYGSGAGPWSGYPSYEDEAEKLLLDYSTLEVLSTIEATPMTDRQWEGAARYFGGWDFGQTRPDDLGLLPSKLKAALLERAVLSKDRDKVQRARKAFGE